MSNGFVLSAVPTTPAPPATACDSCGVDVDAVWTGRGWSARARCAACIERAERRELKRELLAAWEPALLDQVGPLHYEQAPDDLMAELVAFGERGANRLQSAVYLYGPVGTGKTQQLVWMGQRVIRHLAARGQRAADCPVVYVRLPQLLTALRSEEQTVGYYQRAPWLLLDELAAEELTPWAMAQLTEVVEHRLRWCLPTIYASNFSLRQLANGAARGWDERLVARMVQQVGQGEDYGLIGHYGLTRQMRVKGVQP
jgi:DNA replication protein DnaC